MSKIRLSPPRLTKCICGEKHEVNIRMMSTHHLYHRWVVIMHRCYNKKSKMYINYGGRGIRVDPRWHVFSSFIEDMEDSFQEGLTLERKDNNLGYSKENCEWISAGKQALNRRNNRMITYKKETRPLSDWARRLGLSHAVIGYRLKAGWDIDKALGTPIIRSKRYFNHAKST